jgi:biopolymer transport protein ExbD
MRRNFNRPTASNINEININITPLISILFLLLVIYMVLYQSSLAELNIELPSAKAKIVLLPKDPIKVIIDVNGSIMINNREVKLKDLVSEVNKLSLKDKNMKIYVMADRRNEYGKVLDVVSRLNDNDFKDVVLISDALNRL